MKQYSVILIGAGLRGKAYTDIMYNCSDKFKVVAVAEPEKNRRDYIKNKHGLSDDMCFNSYEEILSKPKMADLALITTMDDLHYLPAMKAIELGYDILLEKPVAPTEKECVDILLAAEKKGVKVLVCHVLRYTPFFKAVKNGFDNARAHVCHKLSRNIGQFIVLDAAVDDIHADFHRLFPALDFL